MSSGSVMVETLTSAPIPAWLDYAALVVGSLAGVAEASTRRLDLVGHVGLSMLCGLGGGLVRDVVMQVGTEHVYMLSSPYAILISTLVGLVGFLFPRFVAAHPNLLEWLDMVSVGLFCVVGTNKALAYGLNPAACVLMGTLTGVGGGMLRDVFLGDVPRIFQSGNLYALCAVAGSLAYWMASSVLSMSQFVAVVSCVVTAVALRRLSLRFGVRTTTSSEDLELRIRTIGDRAKQKVTARSSHATEDDDGGSQEESG